MPELVHSYPRAPVSSGRLGISFPRHPRCDPGLLWGKLGSGCAGSARRAHCPGFSPEETDTGPVFPCLWAHSWPDVVTRCTSRLLTATEQAEQRGTAASPLGKLRQEPRPQPAGSGAAGRDMQASSPAHPTSRPGSTVFWASSGPRGGRDRLETRAGCVPGDQVSGDQRRAPASPGEAGRQTARPLPILTSVLLGKGRGAHKEVPVSSRGMASSEAPRSWCARGRGRPTTEPDVLRWPAFHHQEPVRHC